MRPSRILICSAICFLSTSVKAFDLTKLNLNYQYDLRDEVRLTHRVMKTGDDMAVLYELTADPAAVLTLTLLLQPSYNSPTHDTLKTYTIDTLSAGPKPVYKLTLGQTGKNDLLIISIGHKSLGVYWLFDVRVGSPLGFPDYHPIVEDKPLLKPFVASSQVAFSGSDSYHCYRYSDQFGPADPPMGQMKALSPTLTVDSSFYFSGEIELDDNYVFSLFQKDSTDATGITLLKVPEYFPKQKKIDELVGPLTYICTESEITTMKQSPNMKEVFERFWINSYGTQLRAKGAIRQYYDWVEEANQLFTDYKPGWQTDRGMIYIIFGKPENVKRTENSEIWQYGTTEFEFIRIPSLFTPYLYTLKRDIKYEKVWYTRVGAIRKG